MPKKNKTSTGSAPPRAPVTVARLEEALYVVAVLVEDCALYLPLFVVLENALEEARAGEAAADRARRIVEQTAARFSPGADERSGRTGRDRVANRGRRQA